MGLLDGIVGSSLDDPRTMATMQLAQGLLSSPRAMQGLSGGLLGYGQVMQQAKQQQMAQQMQALQMQQHQMALQQAQRAMQRQNAMEALPEQFMGRAIKPDTMDNRDVGQPGEQRMQQGPFDMAGYAQAMFKYDPKEALALQQYLRKDTTPIKLGAGEALYDPQTLKPLASNPKDDAPSAIKEYNFAKAQGYPGTLQQFLLEQKRAGASSVSVSMDKGFGDTFAKQAAESLGASRDQAKAAANTISSLDRIDAILKGGNVAVGPGQQAEITVRQIADKLGAGKDNAERLANTRELIQKASALAVDGAKMLAGQGQITEGERALVARAAGGDIDKLTAPEISALTGALRKVNNAKLQQHQQLLSKVSPQFGAFAPFYQVDAPTPEAAPSGGARTVKRTGMLNGKRVVEYSDGTVEYAGN